MPRFLLLLLLLICLSFSPLFALTPQGATLPLGVMDLARAQSNLDISRVSPELTTLSFQSGQLVESEQLVDYRTYRTYSVPGEAGLCETGKPALPRMSRLCRIPNLGGVELQVVDAEFDLVENVDILPYQEEGAPFGAMARDAALYGRDEWFPATVAELSDPMLLRDFRVVTVTMYPVQYNPVSRQARVYRVLNVAVVGNDAPGINEYTLMRPPSGVWAPVYRGLISNLDDHALDEVSTTPGTYLILSTMDSAVSRWDDSLFQWKTRKGFKTVVERRPNWTATTMQSYIQNAYATWNPPLEFVCLMGDPPPATAWGVPSDATDSWSVHGYDHTFALGNGGDDLEDIGVGRLSGRSFDQMSTINAKIMGYERDPYMADTLWFRKTFLYATINPPSGTPITSNYTLMQWAAQQFTENTRVNSHSVQWVQTGINQSTINQNINGGVGYFFWRGSWVGQMQNNCASQTNPGWRLPVCFTITCSAGNFVNDDGVSEGWLTAGSRTNPQGGVACIGTATSMTHNPPNATVAGGIVYAVTDLLLEYPGTVLNSSKVWLSLAFGTNSEYATNFSRFNNLMGDPGLSMWTDVPTVITAEHPHALSIGARGVEVTVQRTADGVPVADALVVLWKRSPDSTWVRGLTDAAGHVTLPVNVNAAGNMFLTVTKRNHKPYLFTIPCGQADVMPMLSTYALDDDNMGGTIGNGDGVLNAGETIDLPIFVRNFGSTATATGLSATLTSNNGRVTVVTGTSAYADLAPGDSALGAVPFRIHVSPDMMSQEQALLTMTITSAQGPVYGAITVGCSAPDVRYASHRITGGMFDPGTTRNLSVTVVNRSTVGLSGATGHLTSLSPYVEVQNADILFGDMAPGARDSNDATPYSVSANLMAFRGHRAPMRLVMTTPAGFSDTTTFELALSPAATADPTGPDAYGYYAYDNTDVSYDFHPTFQYLNISSGLGTNLNLNDPGEKSSVTVTYSTAFALPFGFKYYGRVYDTLTVCSNGWMAFGDQSWNDCFRNFPMPAMQSADAMIAPYWDDLKTQGGTLGVWKYYQPDSGRFVVQWKAQGAFNPNSLDFEVILYDTTMHPTFDGNGRILFQYQTVTMNMAGDAGDVPGCAVGIQAPGNLVGLPYAYQSSYWPGAAPISTGRAMLFTTESRMMFGQIIGQVLDAATNQPLAGAAVSVEGYGYHATTDALGNYHLANVLIGSYQVRAERTHYNPMVSATILVELNQTVIQDFRLAHPELSLSVDSVADSIGGLPVQRSLIMTNAGNGPLEYSVHVLYGGSEHPTPWDSVGGISLTDSTGDAGMLGCEFAFNQWWVTGSAGDGTDNRIYRFDRQGRPLGSIPQYSSTNMGWFDLASDGQYLYGSDGGMLYGVDTLGVLRDSIPSPLNPARGIAYDPVLDHFWVADYDQSLYEIDRDGNQFRVIPNTPVLYVTGLAWDPSDPNGFNLYLFSQNGSTSLLRVSRMNPNTRTFETAVDLRGVGGERSGGCAITPGWNSALLVFGAIIQGNREDRLSIYEMAFNTTWISVSPGMGTVPEYGTGALTLSYDPASLQDGQYRVALHIECPVLDTTRIVPVTLTVDRVRFGVKPLPSQAVPEQYALYQNYPNPFNPTTTIRYDLKSDALTTLTVYNLLGEKVADLVHERQGAGHYAVPFDASALPSGMYFYRLVSGSYAQSEKMILLK
jgi:hypothetical protein